MAPAGKHAWPTRAGARSTCCWSTASSDVAAAVPPCPALYGGRTRRMRARAGRRAATQGEDFARTLTLNPSPDGEGPDPRFDRIQANLIAHEYLAFPPAT